MYSLMDALVLYFFHLFYTRQVKRSADQLVGIGSAIGSVFGPVGTVVGGFFGGILCIFFCDDGKFCFRALKLMKTIVYL